MSFRATSKSRFLPASVFPQDIAISFDYNGNRVVTLQVDIVGTDQVYTHKLNHVGVRRPHEPPQSGAGGGKDGKTLVEAWQEELTPVIRMGNMFLKGYRMYMSDDDRKELETALQKANEALAADNETDGKKHQVMIENKIMGSSVASTMYFAENVMQGSTRRQAEMLAPKIAQLRQAHASGQNTQIERLQQDVSAMVADILSAKAGIQPVLGKDFRGLLKVKNEGIGIVGR
jgi:hypothetical protein